MEQGPFAPKPPAFQEYRRRAQENLPKHKSPKNETIKPTESESSDRCKISVSTAISYSESEVPFDVTQKISIGHKKSIDSKSEENDRKLLDKFFFNTSTLEEDEERLLVNNDDSRFHIFMGGIVQDVQGIQCLGECASQDACLYDEVFERFGCSFERNGMIFYFDSGIAINMNRVYHVMTDKLADRALVYHSKVSSVVAGRPKGC